VLTVMSDKGLNSLWLRNVATGSDTQVVPPSATIPNVAFSPDGDYIYFRKAENAIASDFNVYRAPVLGGTPKAVVHDVDSALAFSPDGRRMAYIRGNNPETGKYRLLDANLDGSDEKVLHIAAFGFLPRWLNWSPNGRQIAYPEGQLGNALGGINLFNYDTGKIRTLTFIDKAIWGMTWSPGGDGIFVIYQQKGPNFNRRQIGYVSLADGELHSISRDTNSYSTLSLSADGKVLATVQQKIVSNFYVLPGGGSTSADIAPFSSSGEHIQFFNWMADGSLLTSDLTQLTHTDANGQNPSQVVSDPAANILSLSPCGTPLIVFPWAFHDGNSVGIWRINADGSNPIKLADETFDTFPVCAANSNWVYYPISREHSAGANQERDASSQAHDQCRRELRLGHPCVQVPSLEGDRILYACGGWMPPPPLVTLLPLVLAQKRSAPLGRYPEPTYAFRWLAPPGVGSLGTSAESIRPFASREPDPVYRDRSRPARAGHCAAQHRRSTLPRPAPVQILRPALPGVHSACESC
jgi:Tol biopolymer transport system component